MGEMSLRGAAGAIVSWGKVEFKGRQRDRESREKDRGKAWKIASIILLNGCIFIKA